MCSIIPFVFSQMPHCLDYCNFWALKAGSVIPTTLFFSINILLASLDLLPLHLGCSNFWGLWATLKEEELSWATHQIHKHYQKLMSKKKVLSKVFNMLEHIHSHSGLHAACRKWVGHPSIPTKQLSGLVVGIVLTQ